MTKPWKLKTNASNILLVLITLILIKAEWSKCEIEQSWESNNLDEGDAYVEYNHKPTDEIQVYVGNDNIAQYFFQSSANNSSLILNNVNLCLENFQLLTCLKMLLLNRINNVIKELNESNFIQKDLFFLNGLVSFKVNNKTEIHIGNIKNDSENTSSVNAQNDVFSLDDEISQKVLRLFHNRTLQVKLLSGLKLDIIPIPKKKKEDFMCFSYKVQGPEVEDGRTGQLNQWQGRKKKKSGMSMFMMLPQMLMMGFLPFTLATLKSMVMNAVMINMMALNGAIMMTIRNLVFGPRQGSRVQYVNYGYSKDRQNQSRRPVLIIHSPAAFVKQPNVRPFKKNYYSPHNHQILNENQFHSHGQYFLGEKPYEKNIRESFQRANFNKIQIQNARRQYDTINNTLKQPQKYKRKEGSLMQATTRNVFLT